MRVKKSYILYGLLAAIGLCIGLLAGPLAAQESTSPALFWNPPETRTNGAVLSATEIGGYEICAETEERLAACATPLPVGAGTTSVPVESLDLGPGQWYFKVRVQDTDGLVSAWSTTVPHFIQALPNPPV